MSDPKLTVCVITYNQEAYIGRCLESLVDQVTNFAFEIVVGDDCSRDGTRAVIEEFRQRYPDIVRPLLQPANSGGSRNYLDVHAAARGEYVAHVDGDDYALPGKLQAQVDMLDRDPACNVVWHRMDLFDDVGGFCSGLTADLSSFPDGRVEFSDAAKLGYVAAHSSIMYRRAARTPLTDFEGPILDIYLTWDLLCAGHGRVLDEVFGRYRVSAPGSLTAANDLFMRRLAIAHAREFLHRKPRSRHDFGLWAMSNVIIDIKGARPTALDYARFALECGVSFDPRKLLRNLVRMKRTQVRWDDRERPKQSAIGAKDAAELMPWR